MTLNDLKERVMHLGFERTLDDEAPLLTATHRALYTLFLDRPRIKTCEIFVPLRLGTLISRSLVYKPGEALSFSLSGVAVSFRASGRGKVKLREDGGERIVEFSGTSSEIRLPISGKASLEFLGSYTYTVTSLASFEALSGPDVSDIPIYLDSHKIDLANILPDFLAPAERVRDLSGEIIEGAEITSGTLTLPHSTYGGISLRYCRAPKLPTGDDEAESLDLPEEARELLPLLVASYMWLDDDPEKAQYYRALYDAGIRVLNFGLYRSVGGEYKTDGWA